jgi:hypothetical protein
MAYYDEFLGVPHCSPSFHMFQQVHVEDMVLGERDTAEQVVSLAGPTSQIQLALPMILEKVEMGGELRRCFVKGA